LASTFSLLLLSSLAFSKGVTVQDDPLLPACVWLIRDGNIQRTRSCRTAYSQSSFAFAQSPPALFAYDRPLCSFQAQDPACSVQCPSLYRASWSAYALSFSGDYILAQLTVSGYQNQDGTGFLVRSAAMVLSVNGTHMLELRASSYMNSFSWSGISSNRAFLDDHGRLVWSGVWIQDQADQFTVVTPRPPERPAVWTVSSRLNRPQPRTFATPPAIIGDTVFSVETNTFPTTRGLPRVRNITSGAVIATAPADSTVTFGVGVEFIPLESPSLTPVRQIMVLGSTSATLFTPDLSTRVSQLLMPVLANAWKCTAMDTDNMIFYAWSYGLAGGDPSQMMAYEVSTSKLIWQVNYTSNSGTQSLLVVPGVGVIAVSAQSINSPPAPSNTLRLFALKDGQVLWSNSSIDFAWRGVLGLSHNRVAIPRLGWLPNGGAARGYFGIYDATTGSEIFRCPATGVLVEGSAPLIVSAAETTDNVTVFALVQMVQSPFPEGRVPRLRAVPCRVPGPVTTELEVQDA
jgi:hypothetical protein